MSFLSFLELPLVPLSNGPLLFFFFVVVRGAFRIFLLFLVFFYLIRLYLGRDVFLIHAVLS